MIFQVCALLVLLLLDSFPGSTAQRFFAKNRWAVEPGNEVNYCSRLIIWV